MRKQLEIREQTKRNIEHAFWRLYEQKSIEKIGIKEITDLAGYNRGTFYLYYKDIYDVLEKSEQAILNQIQILLEKNLPEVANRNFSTLISDVHVLIKPYAFFLRILLGSNGDPKFTKQLKELFRPLIQGIFVEEFTDYEKYLLEEFLLSGIIGILHAWNKDPQINIDEFIDFFLENFFKK